MPKRTYSPSVKKNLRVHGFRSRNKNKARRRVLKSRSLKGRKVLV